MTTVMGCIADDFTGATDLAGLLARSGVRVSLRIGVPKGPPDTAAPFEVIALKIRTAPVAQAVATALDAFEWLRRAGAPRMFWKYCSTFDSTERGNIGPVSEALMEALGTRQTLYCPAFPENGRSVYMGNLFVGTQPLAESPMKDHPLTPMRDSNLMRVLGPQVTRPTGLVDRRIVAAGADAVRTALARLAADGVFHVVVDAVAEEDLASIALACRAMPLITGGSAIARHLPDLLARAGLLAPDAQGLTIPPLGAGTIILSGSCSDMTNRQVADYLARSRPAHRLDPFDLSEKGVDAAVAWVRQQDFRTAPLVYATADPASVRAAQERLGPDRAGELVEEALAACAVAAREAGARRFVVAGGETSGAVTQALGVDRLDIGPEIAPGVPWCFAATAGLALAITLKSGNFGAEGFFSDALEVLRSLEAA